jgi:hypothetical protein
MPPRSPTPFSAPRVGSTVNLSPALIEPVGIEKFRPPSETGIGPAFWSTTAPLARSVSV